MVDILQVIELNTKTERQKTNQHEKDSYRIIYSSVLFC